MRFYDISGWDGILYPTLCQKKKKQLEYHFKEQLKLDHDID